jgi:hypothetical protein
MQNLKDETGFTRPPENCSLYHEGVFSRNKKKCRLFGLASRIPSLVECLGVVSDTIPDSSKGQYVENDSSFRTWF